MKLAEIEVAQITTSDNVRGEGWEKDVDDLVKSIQAVGLLQPPILRKEGKQYKVVCGARRVEACRQLNMKTIPALVINEGGALEFWQKKLAENSGRKNLSPIEEAKIFQQLKSELKIASKDIATAMGVTDAYISQRLQLLKLPEEVQEALRTGKIAFAHARELSRIPDANTQRKLLKIAEKHSPEQFVEKLNKAEKRQTERGRPAKTTKGSTTVRTVAEIKKAAADVDRARVAAIEEGNQLREEFYKGMLRGLGWAGGMVDNLL